MRSSSRTVLLLTSHSSFICRPTCTMGAIVISEFASLGRRVHPTLMCTQAPSMSPTAVLHTTLFSYVKDVVLPSWTPRSMHVWCTLSTDLQLHKRTRSTRIACRMLVARLFDLFSSEISREGDERARGEQILLNKETCTEILVIRCVIVNSNATAPSTRTAPANTSLDRPGALMNYVPAWSATFLTNRRYI